MRRVSIKLKFQLYKVIGEFAEKFPSFKKTANGNLIYKISVRCFLLIVFYLAAFTFISELRDASEVCAGSRIPLV